MRRGFYTEITNGTTNRATNCSYFFTDNFFAAYFCKFAIDGYVPSYDEFKCAMISRKFPATCKCTKDEKEKAAYSLDGKNPGFGKAGYKISHIIDVGKEYFIKGKTKSINDWCKDYKFTRGDSGDYKKAVNGNYYVRKMSSSQLNMSQYPLNKAKEVLKAHFLRFVCPFNYVLTPKREKPKCQEFPKGVHIKGNDIGEMPEFLQYAKDQLRKYYGPDYDDFLKRVMIDPNLASSKIPNSTKQPGNTIINISYGLGISNTGSEPQGGKTLGIGQRAKRFFTKLLTSEKLSDVQINNLRNKKYCKDKFGISYPVIADINVDHYDPKRFYKKPINDKYVICSQWYARNEAKIENWRKNNGFASIPF